MPSAPATLPDDAIERANGHPLTPIAGVDEVGRGPLAGPVVAAAVLLPPEGLEPDLAGRIRDSKRLKAPVREALAVRIAGSCVTAIAQASVAEIDTLNILQASLLAMRRAIAALAAQPAVALIDGNRCPTGLPCRAEAIIKGDARCITIAAASILAKVHRDALMTRLSTHFPGYGWERNAGYPTAQHRQALDRLGVSPHHRRSFAPVSQRLAIID